MPGNTGNARDNRQRGNAAQLLEKYKNMARDSQLAGDRVQTEYYLQFADHYFRVLGESRVRFEEQRRQHGDDDGDDEGEELVEAEGDGEFESSERQPRRRISSRDDRGPRDDREDRTERGPRRPAANGRGVSEPADDGQRIPFDALPPAIGADDPSDHSIEAEPARPARRPRRPRETDNEGDGATV